MDIISHPLFLKHDLEGHVERADRIRKALKTFKYKEAKDGEAYLNKVHTQRYIDAVKKASRMAGVQFLDSGETYVTTHTYNAACHAVGAAVMAAESARKKKPAFALVRPPGHHAHPDWTNGFCIFNNMAIAAVWLAEKGERVLIVDIDLHRGDGTGDCVSVANKDFEDRLFYFSINQQGVFPGVSIDEGNVHNMYVDPGTSEKDYDSLLQEELTRIIKSFKPTIIGVCAGFDSFVKDKENYCETLGCALSLTSKTIYLLKSLIGKIPYFAVLEGGYDPDGVVEGVKAFVSKVKVVKGNKMKTPSGSIKRGAAQPKKVLTKNTPQKKRPVKKKGVEKPPKKKPAAKKKPLKKKPAKKTDKKKPTKNKR